MIFLMCSYLLLILVAHRCIVPIVCFLSRIPENCELQHKCRKLCFEKCGDCRTLVPRTLHCGHTVDLHCCVDPEQYKCLVEVEAELLDCGHKVKKPCHMNTDLIPCSYPCEDRLPCGHSCTFRCHKKDDPDHLQVSTHIYKFIFECCVAFLSLCVCTHMDVCRHTHLLVHAHMNLWMPTDTSQHIHIYSIVVH
jgi:hypothetical protein